MLNFQQGAPSVTEITGEQAIAITVPVAGDAPQGIITAGEGYTGAITWNPADANFGYGAAYTANVVLTAAATHKFAAGATATVVGSTGVTGNTISADAAANTLTFAATFPATAADPDVAIVAGVKSAIEGQTITPIAQASCADGTAAKSELNRQIQAMSLNGATATVNEGTYTAPVAGEAGTPNGTNGSYTATVTLNKGTVTETTAQITLTITATAYVDPSTTVAPAFTSNVASKATATEANVTFTLTADGTGNTFKVYSDDAGTLANGITAAANGTTLTLTHATDVAAGTYYISATESGKSESAKTMVTVADPVAPTKPLDPSNGTVEQPGTTTGQTSYDFTYRSTEAGTPAMGTVTLKRQDDQAFDLNSPVQADTVYTMTAAPAAGYKFTTWEKKTRAINPTSMTISGTFDELSVYTAQFAAISVNGPKLDQMTLSGADKAILLQMDNSRNGFASDVLDYKTYLMPGATGFALDMVIQAPATETMSTVVTVDGTAITPTTTTANGLTTYSYNKAITTTSGNVAVVLTDGAKTSTYTIAVATVSAKPRIVMDVTAGTSGEYDLAVNLENTIANEFTFSLKLDTTAFVGFTDGAAELTNGDVKAAIAAQLEGNSAFEVAKATYDATNNTLVVAMVSKANSYVDCTAKTQIATLKFETVDNNSASAENLAKLTIDSVNKGDSALTDQRFEGFIETTADGKTGLILINLPDEMFIAGFVNSLMKADVQKNIASIVVTKTGASTPTATTKPGADRSFSAKVSQGTYTVVITLTNYVERTITVDGTEESIIGAIALVAGDVNNSGAVDALDRSELLDQLFTSVTPGAKFDIDGDGRVNGSDLGYLLSNITAVP